MGYGVGASLGLGWSDWEVLKKQCCIYRIRIEFNTAAKALRSWTGEGRVSARWGWDGLVKGTPEPSNLSRFCDSKEQIWIGIRLQLCGCSDHSFHSPLRPRPRAPLFPLRTPAKRPTHVIRINPTHHHLPPHTPRIDTRQLAPRLHRPGRMPGLWQIGVVAQRRVATIQRCAGRRRQKMAMCTYLNSMISHISSPVVPFLRFRAGRGKMDGLYDVESPVMVFSYAGTLQSIQ